MEIKKIIKNYLIKDKIGEGSYSQVYKAYNMSDNQDYVIKVIKVKNPLKQLQEVDLLKNINHNNVIQFRDLIVENNILYMVMDFADGGDLQKVKFILSSL
jgi:serine/threonine protein kinase